MTRTTLLKVLYVVALVTTFAAGLILLAVARNPLPAGILFCLLLLVPGRVQGAMWRDFFRGRRLMDLGRPEEARPYFERFQQGLQRRPALVNLMWMSWGIYTRDIRAMTDNNLGVINLVASRLEEAAHCFGEAMRWDPKYPLPHFNMALVEVSRERLNEATNHLAQARRLGYDGTRADALIQDASALLARIEGRREPPAQPGSLIPDEAHAHD